MNPIDIRISSLPFLLNDFFRHLHRDSQLRVFLCGKQVSDAPYDLRKQIRRLIERQMGCAAFLGEDIEEIKIVSKNTRDFLTIEVNEAKKSDIIILFLESPGTISELTAFALDRSINPKLVVFNDQQYKDAKSFVNLGPMKLLSEDRVIFYRPTDARLFSSAIAEIDTIVAREWFKRSSYAGIDGLPLEFDQFVTLAIVYASFPVRYKELEQLFTRSHKALDKSLKSLFEMKLVGKKENKFIPLKSLDTLPLPVACQRDFGRVRAALMNRRLVEQDAITDYRLLF